MIKINLLAEKKTTKAKPAGPTLELGGSQNYLLVGILLVGVLVSAGWWWTRSRDLGHWRAEMVKVEKDLERLKEVRKKAEEFKARRALLEKKIALITDLKKRQTVPVHILDQISKNLPDFLWLDSMTSVGGQISLSGKATTYTAVSNFYDSLQSSGYFTNVVLGKTSEVPEGVAFSLSCRFTTPEPAEPEPPPQG